MRVAFADASCYFRELFAGEIYECEIVESCSCVVTVRCEAVKVEGVGGVEAKTAFRALESGDPLIHWYRGRRGGGCSFAGSSGIFFLASVGAVVAVDARSSGRPQLLHLDHFVHFLVSFDFGFRYDFLCFDICNNKRIFVTIDCGFV